MERPTNLINFYHSHVIENEDEIKEITSVVAQNLWKTFKINLSYTDTDSNGAEHVIDYKSEIVTAFFCKTFDSIIDQLKKCVDKYSSFELNFADKLVIGYDNIVDEDDEKQGNLMIYISHLNNKNNTNNIEPDYEKNPQQNCAAWNTVNILKNKENINEISARVVEELKKVDVNINSSEVVMPIFIMTYDTLVEYVRRKRTDLNLLLYEINFVNCFNIRAQASEDDPNGDVYIIPSPEYKLALKNDGIATSKYE